MYYNCYVYIVAGSPKFPPEQTNQRIMVNVSDEIILNCTVSASPDPVYSWLFPDSYSSCPHYHNKSVILLNAKVTDSGEYVCIARNEYGNVLQEFNVHVNCK